MSEKPKAEKKAINYRVLFTELRVLALKFAKGEMTGADLQATVLKKEQEYREQGL